MANNGHGADGVKPVTDSTLAELAEDFLREWRQAHGTATGTASALVGPDSFAVHIENAFTRAELSLAGQTPGRALVAQYVEGLLEQVCANLVQRVEAALRQQVLSTGTTVNLGSGWVMCFYKLGEGGPGA